MLRLNLLRDLPPSSHAAPRESAASVGGPGAVDGGAPTPRGGALRPILLILLGLLVLGAASLALIAPRGLDLPVDLARLWARDDRARADSLRLEKTLQALRTDASARIAASQTQAIEWLYHLESALPEPGAESARLTRASFAVPGRFVLRGEAAGQEALSAIQEALVLVPGLDLVESVSGDSAGAATAPAFPETFSFSGTIDFPTDTAAPRLELVATAETLPTRLTHLAAAAAALGITLEAPRGGDVLASGALRLHAYRIAGTLQTPDSTGFTPVRELLETERHDGSPLGIQRVTLENRGGRRLVFLDIMAFTP